MRKFIRISDTLIRKSIITNISIKQSKPILRDSSHLRYFIEIQYNGGKLGEGSFISEKYIMKHDAEKELQVLIEEIESSDEKPFPHF